MKPTVVGAASVFNNCQNWVIAVGTLVLQHIINAFSNFVKGSAQWNCLSPIRLGYYALCYVSGNYQVNKLLLNELDKSWSSMKAFFFFVATWRQQKLWTKHWHASDELLIYISRITELVQSFWMKNIYIYKHNWHSFNISHRRVKETSIKQCVASANASSTSIDQSDNRFVCSAT